MQLVAGIVQLLIFQHLALLMARAMPFNDAKKCNDTSIMSQIHSLLVGMHSKAKNLLDTYERFNTRAISKLCHGEPTEFPKYSLSSSSSEEDSLIELYKIFHYMNTAVGNITQEQRNLNFNNKTLHQKLNQSKSEIEAMISNLSCVLNKRYTVPKIDMYYTINSSSNTITKKANGCKVLKKYTHFLTKAKEIISELEKKGDYTQGDSSDKQTPGHR